MNNYSYRVIIEPDGTQFHAYVPALIGCHTFGDSITEAKQNIREAILAYLSALQADGKEVPEDIGFETVETVSLASVTTHA